MSKPALTPKEWTAALYRKDFTYFSDTEDISDHGKAALYLYNQPFGFNPATDENGYFNPDYVWAIRECADALDKLLKTTTFGMQDDRSIASFAVGFARSAADRIEALLPRKDT